jgi:hypothetical protein
MNQNEMSEACNKSGKDEKLIEAFAKKTSRKGETWSLWHE